MRVFTFFAIDGVGLVYPDGILSLTGVCVYVWVAREPSAWAANLINQFHLLQEVYQRQIKHFLWVRFICYFVAYALSQLDCVLSVR